MAGRVGRVVMAGRLVMPVPGPVTFGRPTMLGRVDGRTAAAPVLGRVIVGVIVEGR